MDRLVTKDNLIDYIKMFDTRCKTWNEEQFDRAIVDGFAEMSTMVSMIVNVHYESLESYYQNAEYQFDINLLGSVTSIYDMYLAKKNFAEETMLEHKILKIRDKNRIWRDSVQDDVIHIDLQDETFGLGYDYVEIKYSYIPVDANFDELLMPSQQYVVLEACIAAAIYNILHDDAFAATQLNRARRLVTGIPDVYPNDFDDDKKPSIFPPGV